MFPDVLPDEVLTNPGRRAERNFYARLREQLPASTVVVYGYRWIDPRDRARALEGEADFTVIDPTRGLLILELKGGVIGRDAQTGQYTSRTLSGADTHAIKDPAFQAASSCRAMRKHIEASRAWIAYSRISTERSRAPFPAHFGIVFPDCVADGKLIAGDITPRNLIDAAHLDRLDERLERMFTDLVGPSPFLPLSDAGMRAVLDVLAYDGTLRRPISVQLADEDQAMLRASVQQLSLLNYMRLQRRVLVKGGAGTGKTLLAVEKARRAAARDRSTLLLCYNRLLGDSLGTGPAKAAGADVMTFHQLCAHTAGLPLRDDADEQYYDVTLPEAAYAALINKEPAKRYQTVVIDEAQDFRPTWFDIVQHVTAPGDDAELFVAMDQDQVPPGQLAQLPAGLSPFVLDENLRNTQGIFDATARLRRGKMTCPGPAGEPPRLVRCDDPARTAELVGLELDRYLREGRLKTRDVVILVGNALKHSRLAATGRAGRYALATMHTPGTAVRLESVWRYKGLEAAVVILAEMEGLAANRQTLYVGATRAKQRLSVIGPPPLLARFG